MEIAICRGMKKYAAGIESSELRLMDAAAPARAQGDAHGRSAPLNGRIEPAAAPSSPEAGAERGTHLSLVPTDAETKPSAPRTDTPPEIPPTGFDRFLIAATKEFEAGIVEQPLWVRALAQASGDRTRGTQGYLRARATALRVQKREKRQERSARRARALGDLGAPDNVVFRDHRIVRRPRAAARGGQGECAAGQFRIPEAFAADDRESRRREEPGGEWAPKRRLRRQARDAQERRKLERRRFVRGGMVAEAAREPRRVERARGGLCPTASVPRCAGRRRQARAAQT